jgi:transcriptional regulator of acetoin/glycerol metabolism
MPSTPIDREESMGRPAVADHADRVLKVIAGNEAASSALAASWRRSGALHALDPSSRAASERLPEEEIARSRERMGPLLAAAQGSIDRLFLAVGGVGCSVVLADPAGVILDRRGAPCDDRLFDGSGLWTGAIWSEKYEGTNGIGTCLVEERAVTIDRDQHFFTRNSGLFCTTAPIFDEHGDLAAALDVSSCRADQGGERAQSVTSHIPQKVEVTSPARLTNPRPTCRKSETLPGAPRREGLLSAQRKSETSGPTPFFERRNSREEAHDKGRPQHCSQIAVRQAV